MRVVLMRHASTRGNELRRYVGKRTDEPLSKRGMRECERFGSMPSVRKAYVSPMLRARQTAKLCFPQAELVVVQGLEEFDFGLFEGRTADEMADDKAYRAWVDSGCTAQCPEGESLEGFVRRTKVALTRVLRMAQRLGEDEVVVVAHGGTIMAALDGFFDQHVGNCEACVAEVIWDGDNFVFATGGVSPNGNAAIGGYSPSGTPGDTKD